MIPPHGTPVSDRPRQTGAIAALRSLRAELHTHRIHPEISYDEGRPRLVISAGLTVWTDHAGMFFCWGRVHLEEPADHAPVDDLLKVATQIAEQLRTPPP